MTPRELVHATTYGAAFAEAMHRGLHGQTRTTQTRSEEAGTEYVRTTIDARAEAHAWATVVAEAAVESYQEGATT